MKSLRCEKCGKTLECDDSKSSNFCPYCGGKLIPAPAAQAASEPMPAPAPAPAGSAVDSAYSARVKSAGIMSVLCAAIAFISLFFPLVIGYKGADLGFDLMIFSSTYILYEELMFGKVLMFIVCWGVFGTSIAALVLSIIALAKRRSAPPLAAWYVLCILCFVFECLYCFSGFTYMIINSATYYNRTFVTLVEIPFVPVVIFFALFKSKYKSLRNGSFTNAAAPVPAPAPAPVPVQPRPAEVNVRPSAAPQAPADSDILAGESKRIEMLKQYKELLDLGAITQEEYDKKKAEILSSGK